MEPGLTLASKAEVCRHFRRGPGETMEHDTLMGLVRLGVLEQVEEGRRGRLRFDFSWTREQVYQAFEEGMEIAGFEAVQRLRKARAGLNLKSMPWSRRFMVSLGRIRNGRPLGFLESQRLLGGSREANLRASREYAELHGQTILEFAHRGVSDTPVEDLLATEPPALGRLPGTWTDAEFGARQEPCPKLVTRACAMEPGPCRSLLALVSVVISGRRSVQSRPAWAQAVECIAAGLRGRLPSDPEALAEVARALRDAATDPRRQRAYLQRTMGLRKIRNLLLDYMAEQAIGGEHPHAVWIRSLMPAKLPPDLQADIWGGTEETDAQALEKRVAKLKGIDPVRLLLGLEGRFRQWDRLTRVAEREKAWIRAEWAAGREVELPRRVSDTYHVIGRDGVPVPGRSQTVRLLVTTVRAECLQLAKENGYRGWPDQTLPAADRLLAPYRREGGERFGPITSIRDGPKLDAADERELVVLYVGTDAEDGGEAIPPFFAELSADGVFIQHPMPDAEFARRRDGQIARYGLGGYLERRLAGVTAITHRRHTMLALALLGTGRTLLPLREFRLMLAFARAEVRMGVLAGVRLHEAMQARHGDGCFAAHLRAGRVVFTMRARPKDWDRDRLFMLDRVTVMALRELKGFVVDMFHRDTGQLPLVPLTDEIKVKAALGSCPPARFLFQAAGKGLRRVELQKCIAISLAGIAEIGSHECRYLFAGRLRRARATQEQIGAALSHSRLSRVTGRYSNWWVGEKDEVVAEQQREMELEVLGRIVGAGLPQMELAS